VGLPKTGTTHLQVTLAANRERLGEQGLHYPVTSRGRQHFLPVLDFLESPFGGIKPADVAGTWAELVRSVQRSSGRALVSHELLSGASADQVGRLTETFAPSPVHLIVTMRDMSKLLPAVWQERTKNRVVESWTQFRAAVAQGPEGGHLFWRLHDLEKVLSAWRSHVPDERVHIVTVPAAPDRHVLIDRFASVIGVDRSGLVEPPEATNESIGLLELAILREVNTAAEDRLTPQAYRSLVKRRLVRDVLKDRPDQLKAMLPASDRQWVETYTRRVQSTLKERSYDIVGDLDDLWPTRFSEEDPGSPASTGEFPANVMKRAMAEVIIDLLGAPAARGAAKQRDA